MTSRRAEDLFPSGELVEPRHQRCLTTTLLRAPAGVGYAARAAAGVPVVSPSNHEATSGAPEPPFDGLRAVLNENKETQEN
jgi:hypothetical protein